MTKSPHFWWLICLLGLIIIALSAYIITDKMIRSEDLMGYISVCSVLISITLSIFAIQYTYTSNNEVHRQFEKINSVAETIRTTSEKLTATSNLLNENLKQILNKLEKIDQSQEDMPSRVAASLTNQPISYTGVNNFSQNSTNQKG